MRRLCKDALLIDAGDEELALLIIPHLQTKQSAGCTDLFTQLTSDSMKKIDLKSVVWKEGAYYISRCLDVEVSSFGKTKKEALTMLTEALELYFEDMPLPKKAEQVKNPIIASVSLSHA